MQTIQTLAPPPSRPPVVTIRPAGRDDLADLAVMVAELAAHHGDPAALSAERLARDLFAPQPWIRALVAESAGDLIGHAILVPAYRANEGARGLDIHQLYVRPAFRSHGIGQHLVATARDEARRSGCTYITVSAATGNLKAHRFYQTLAFTPRPVTGMRYHQVVAG
nr:GNAT family N-acetyltransferase [uncultured Gellertiella sp.]